jgi:hypothetical protein
MYFSPHMCFLHSSLIVLKVCVSLTFPGVVHLNLIVLLNFELDPPLELDQLWLLLSSELDHMSFLLSFEIDQVLLLLT